jgi:hypothetical protein
MREQLLTKIGVRKISTGIFQKYGFNKDKEGTVTSTLLLVDVKSKGNVVSDHLWVVMTKEFETVGTLSKGDKLMFTARVEPYKRKSNRQVDIGLTNLTKIKRCEDEK